MALLKDVKDKDSFAQGYINSEYRKKLLEIVSDLYDKVDRPKSEHYETRSDYVWAVARYDGARSAYEEIIRLLDV